MFQSPFRLVDNRKESSIVQIDMSFLNRLKTFESSGKAKNIAKIF